MGIKILALSGLEFKGNTRTHAHTHNLALYIMIIVKASVCVNTDRKNFISILIVLKAKYNKYINKNKSFNDNCQRAIKITIKVCDHYAQIIQLLKKYFKRDVASITVQLNITKPCIFQYNINDKVVVNMITVPICFHLLLKTPREVY